MNTTRTLIRITAAAVAALIVLGAAPAGAEDGNLASTTGATTTTVKPGATTTVKPGGTTTTVKPTPRPAPGLEGRYQTLTGAMMGQWATRTGADVDDIVGTDAQAAGLGVSGEELRSLGLNGILGNLDAEIAEVTLGVGTTGVNFDNLSSSLPKILNTPDGAVIANGIYTARSLGNLDVPDLSSPGLLAQSAPLSSIGPDSMAFGLFLNQSLTSLSQNSPDVFAAVLRPGGVGDPASSQAWTQARSNAAERLSNGFGGDMLNPCLAVLMSSLASGNTSGNHALSNSDDGCAPCAVAGSYMGGNLGRVFNGDTPQRLIIGDDGVVTDYEWWQQGEGGQSMYYEAYPGLQDALESQDTAERAEGGRMEACAESQAGTSNYLSAQGSGILGRLGG